MPEIAENAPVQESVRKHKRRRRILIFCVVSLLNVGLLALLLTQLLTPTSKSSADPLIGHAAPEFSLTMLSPSASTSKLSLSNFKGKAVVLNFWASWCAPCTEEVPLLENTWKQMQAQGKDVVFLGIDFQETNSAASNFIQQYGITYPAVLDTSGSVANKYGITSLPDTIFIDRNGTVISKESREITTPILSSNLKLIV
ncbi:MAG TPA: TlpA disulfide reductase family protein [Ktedonobacteraceae bacterium]|nr:TlpA disulfide reductase family protein [Ktedonobacteraceae bacterium]